MQGAWFWVAALLGPLVFWLSPKAARPWVLCAVGGLYVASVSVTTVVIAALLGALAFLAGRRAASAPNGGKPWVRGMVVLVLLTLAFWKYVPELGRSVAPEAGVSKLMLPLGLSFYSFRLIHYVIEQAKRALPPHGPGELAAYVFFLPTFVAGPLEPFDHFAKNQDDRPSAEAVVAGGTRIVHGLIKKFLLAELIIQPRDVSAFLASGAVHDAFEVWRFLLLWYVYAYLDFSGYSDLAVGTARLYGIRIVENFRWPILAASVGDFWKRWHISLAAWTQRYVYMPTIGRFRNPYLAIFTTFVALAMWHAATLNYLLWGLFHALGVAAALTWAKVKRQRRWGTSAPKGLLRYWSVPVTFLYVTLSCAFSSTTGHGVGAALATFRGALGLG